MELQNSRAIARVDAAGRLVLLEEQDRAQWDRRAIARGIAALEQARGCGPPGPYTVQAEIAACHATAPTWNATDWSAIAALYALLARLTPTPIVELNRAVAVAMADGAEAGLALVDAIDGLDGYYLLHATRADLLRRLDRSAEAAAAYARALELAPSDVERDFLRGRLSEV